MEEFLAALVARAAWILVENLIERLIRAFIPIPSPARA